MKAITNMAGMAAMLCLFCSAAGCGDSGNEPSDSARNSLCLGDLYPAEEISDYILPWPVGETYLIGQGNCVALGSGSHAVGSRAMYAYDIIMPIGTSLLAVRDGSVIFVEEGFSDGSRVPGEENSVVIQHTDGTISNYGHLTTLGAMVDVGDTVRQGDIIGLSGDSGASTEPHLHFEILACEGEPIVFEPTVSFNASCGSLPSTFRNTRSHPNGLIEGQRYEALSF